MKPKVRKFRATIHVDIFVPENLGEIEKDRDKAKDELSKLVSKIPNADTNGQVNTYKELINNPKLL